MKKLLVHAAYLVVITFFIFYANIKAREAERASLLAEENAVEAQRQREIADMNAAEAIMARTAAEKAMEEAYLTLEECRGKK